MHKAVSHLQRFVFSIFLLASIAQAEPPKDHGPSGRTHSNPATSSLTGLIAIPDSALPDQVRRDIETNAQVVQRRLDLYVKVAVAQRDKKLTEADKKEFLDTFQALYDTLGEDKSYAYKNDKKEFLSLEDALTKNYWPGEKLLAVIVKEFRDGVSAALAKNKVKPEELSWNAVYFADDQGRESKILVQKIAGMVPPPAGKLKEIFDAFREERKTKDSKDWKIVSGTPELTMLYNWALNSAIEKVESSPEVAEAYARLFAQLSNSYRGGSYGGHGESAVFMTDLRKRADTKKKLTFNYKEIPDSKDLAVINATLAENTKLFYQKIKEAEDTKLTKEQLIEKFGPYYMWQTGSTSELTPTTRIEELRYAIIRSLTEGWKAGFSRALNLADKKPQSLNIDALLLADRICFWNGVTGRYGGGMNGCDFHFGKRIIELVYEQQRKEEDDKVAKDKAMGEIPRAVRSRGDFMGTPHSDIVELREWAKTHALKYKDSNPKLAEALALLSSRAEVDKDPESFRGRNGKDETYPLYSANFNAHDALARITGRTPASTLPRNVKFTLVPKASLERVDRYTKEADANRMRDANLLKILPVVNANRDAMLAVLNDLESWDPTKGDAAKIRRDMLAKYGGYIPEELRTGEFDIVKAKKSIIEEVGKEFLGNYDESHSYASNSDFLWKYPGTQYPYPLDYYLLVDRLRDTKHRGVFPRALQDVLVANGLAKEPGSEWRAKEYKSTDKWGGALLNELTDAERLFQLTTHLGAEGLDADPAHAARIAAAFEKLDTHPKVMDPKIAEALGLVHSLLKHRGDLGHSLLADNHAQSGQGARNHNPIAAPAVAVAADKIPAAPKERMYESLGACVDGTTATENIRKHRGNGNPGQTATFLAIKSDMTVEQRIGALRTNKDILYEALIAWEEIDKRARFNQTGDGPKPPPGYEDSAVRFQTIIVEQRRTEMLDKFLADFSAATAGRAPGEKVAYPPDLLLLVDRIEHAKNTGVTQNLFLAKVLSVLKNSKIPDSVSKPMREDVEKVMARGFYPDEKSQQGFVLASRLAIEFCRKNPKDCAHDTEDTLIMVMNMAMNDWRPLKKLKEGNADVAAPFSARNSNRASVLACAKEDLKPLLLPPNAPRPADAQVADTSWQKPESFPDKTSPLVPYPNEMGNDLWNAITDKNQLLVAQAMEILRRPDLSHDDFVKFFGPYYQKEVGPLPAKDAWATAKNVAALKLRNALISDVFKRYYARVNNDAKIAITDRLIKHPLSGFPQSREPVQNVLATALATLEPKPGEKPAEYGKRREDLRKWILGEFGRDGMASDNGTVRRLLALTIEGMDDHAATEWNKPRKLPADWATQAVDHTRGEVAKRAVADNAGRVRLLDKIVSFYEKLGKHVPSEVRRWILDGVQVPNQLAALTDVFMKHEPDAFMALLIDHDPSEDSWSDRIRPYLPGWMAGLFGGKKKISRDEAIIAISQKWGRFAMLPATPLTNNVEENQKRAKEALEMLAKYKFTEGDIENLFGDYYKSRTGWGFIDELSNSVLDRRYFGDFNAGRWAGRVASDTDKLGLKSLLMDELLGIKHYLSDGGGDGQDLASVLAAANGGPAGSAGEQFDKARGSHGQVWKEAAERRGVLFSLARDYWRPNETRADGMRAYARMLFSPAARGLRVDPNRAEKAEKQASKIGNTLSVLRAVRGKTPTDDELAKLIRQHFFGLADNENLQGGQVAQAADILKFIKLARDFEHKTPTPAEITAGLAKHVGGTPTEDDKSDAKNVVEAMRVLRAFGDFTKKEGNPYAVDGAEHDTFKAWAQTWHDKILEDGKRLQRVGGTRDELKAHEELLITRNELERMLGHGPSLAREPAESVQPMKEDVPKVTIYVNPHTKEIDVQGLYQFVQKVIDAPTENERTRLLKSQLNISLHDKYKETFRPSLRPKDLKPESFNQYAEALRPHDERYVLGLEKLRGKLLCDLLNLRDGWSGGSGFRLTDDTPDGVRDNPVKMRAMIMALTKSIAAVDSMLIAGLPAGESERQIDMLRRLTSGDMHGYERVLFAELDAVKAEPNGRYCRERNFYAKLNDYDVHKPDYYEKRLTDDELFLRVVQNHTDNWSVGRGWQGVGDTWRGHEPKSTAKPERLKKYEPLKYNEALNEDMNRTLSTFGYGRMLHLVPEEIPASIERALAALPKERQDYFRKQWKSRDCKRYRNNDPTQPCLEWKDIGIQTESEDLVKSGKKKEEDAINGGLEDLGPFLNISPWKFAEDTGNLIAAKFTALHAAGNDLQKASDLRKAWYESIMDEYWNGEQGKAGSAHAVGVSGLPTLTRQELRKMNKFDREYFLRTLEEMNDNLRQMIGEAQRHDSAGKHAEADALRKKIRDLRMEQMNLVYAPSPALILHHQWADNKVPNGLRDRYLNGAEHYAKNRNNIFALDVIKQLRDFDKLTVAQKEELRAPLLRAFETLQRKNGPESELVDEDVQLAHYLTSMLSVLDDHGHITKGAKDKEYREEYEQIRSGGNRLNRFNPYTAMALLAREQKLLKDNCGRAERARNCDVLKAQVEKMHTEGFGLSTEARSLLLDKETMKDEALDGLARAELVLSHVNDPHSTGAAKKELFYLRLSPSPQKIAQVLNRWDRAYQDYLSTQRQRVDLSEAVIKDLLKAARNGKVIAATIKAKAAGEFKQVECKDVRPKSATDENAEYDFITNIAPDQATGMLLATKLREMARMQAYMKAYERLSRNDQKVKPEDLKSLTEELFTKEFSNIENDMRKLAAERLLAEEMKPGVTIDKLGFEDPKKPLGCALRALLGSVNREEAVRLAKDSYEKELDEIADRIHKGDEPKDNPGIVAKVKGWGPKGTPYFKAERDKEVKKLVDDYAKTADFHNDVDAEYAKLVGQHDKGKVEARAMVTGNETKAKVRDHLFACVDHFENKVAEKDKAKLPETEAEMGADLEKKTKHLQDEIQSVQLMNAVLQREIAVVSIKVEPTFGSLKSEVDFLWNPDKENPGHIQRLEEDYLKMFPKKGEPQEVQDKKNSKENIEARNEIEKTLGDYRNRLARARENLYRERNKLEAMMSSPLEGRKTVEEEDADDLIKRRIHDKIGNEIEKLFTAAKDAAKKANQPEPTYKGWPSAEFIAALEQDPEITGTVGEFTKKKMDAHEKFRDKYAVPEKVVVHGEDHRLTELKTRSVVRQAIMELRAQRIDVLRNDLMTATAARTSSVYEKLAKDYTDFAARCMKWLEETKGIKFDKVQGDQSVADNMVFKESDKLAVAQMLKNHQVQRQQLDLLAKAMSPSVGVNNGNATPFSTVNGVTQNNTLKDAVDALKKQMREGLDTARVPEDHLTGMVSQAFAKNRDKVFADTNELSALLSQLAPMGFKWNGLALTWGEDLDLSGIGKMGSPFKNMTELRHALEKFGSFGKYPQTGTDPWMELVSGIYNAYQSNSYKPRFEFGKTAIHLVQFRKNQPPKEGETKETSTGEVGNGLDVRDFVTDMANADKYIDPQNLDEVRRQAQAAAQGFRRNLEEYSRRRRDLVGGANRVLPVGWDDKGLDMEGRYMTRKWGALNETHEELGKQLDALEKQYGGISFDWETGGQTIKVRAHSLATTLRNQKKYLTDPDFFKNVPTEVFKAVDAQEKFIKEMIVTEALLLAADLLTFGATELARPLIEGAVWGARAARIARAGMKLYGEVKHGLRLANYSAFLGKALGDVYGNLRYGAWDGNGDPEVAGSWDATLKGAQHSRWIFGLLPVVNAGLTAGLNVLRVPAQLAPYIVGPVGMAGVSYGVELAHGQDPNMAWHNAQHSIFLGTPFGDIMGKVGARIPFIAKSPAAQRLLGTLGTYGVFAGHSLWRARQEQLSSGKYINPYTGEEVKADDIMSSLIFDTMASGAVLDVYFAAKAGREVQAATARTMLRRGVPPDQIIKIYNSGWFQQMTGLKAEKGKEILQEALSGFSIDEVRKLHARSTKLAKEAKDDKPDLKTEAGRKRHNDLITVQSLLDAIARQSGFTRENGEDGKEFVKYLEMATEGGDRMSSVGELMERVKKVARDDLAKELKANNGRGFHKYLKHSLFQDEKGQFDPAAFRYIPLEYLQKALGHADPEVREQAGRAAVAMGGQRKQGRDMLERFILGVYYHFAGQESRAPYFAEFVRTVKIEDKDDLQKLVRIFRNATPDSIRKMLLEGKITPEGLVKSFPPEEVMAALDHLTVADIKDWLKKAKDDKDPNHMQALVLMHALATRGGMEAGLFMMAFERYAKDKEGAGNERVLAAVGLPAGTDARQAKRMREVYAQLSGPITREIVREAALKDSGKMDAFVGDDYFKLPANHHILPAKALNLDPATGAGHIAYVHLLAEHANENDADLKKFQSENGLTPRDFGSYAVEYLKKNKNKYEDIPTAIADAKAEFLKEGKARVAELKKRATEMDPTVDTAKKTPAQVRAGISEMFNNIQLTQQIQAANAAAQAPEAAPTAQAVEKALKHLESADAAAGATPSTHALDAVIDLVKLFPKSLPKEHDGFRGGGSDPSLPLARKIVESVLRSPHGDAASKFLAEVRKAPNGGRLLSLIEPKDFKALLEKANANKPLHHTEVWGMTRDMMNESEVVNQHLPEGERISALQRLHDLAVVAMEHLQARPEQASKNLADKVNEQWLKVIAKARLTAPVVGVLEKELDKAASPDLSQQIRIKAFEPKLMAHPNIRTILKDDGKVTLIVKVTPSSDARTARLEQDLVRAAEGTADGDYVPATLHNGALEIRFQDVSDKTTNPASTTAVPNGRKLFVDRMLSIIEQYNKDSQAPVASNP